MREFPPSHPTAPAQLGLLGAWGFWSPVGSLPASLWWRCGPGIEQSPGNARPWWEGLGLSLTILGALRHPCKVWPAQREGRHLARHDLYPSLGLLAVPPATSVTHLPTLGTAGVSREIT